MHATALTRALVIASIVLANGAYAGVQKCIDASGRVTLTDETCPADSSTVKIIGGAADGIDTAPATEHGEPPSAYYATPRTSRYATLYVAPRPRGMALDVAMLKQARARLHLQDNAPRALGGQRVAGLN